MPGSEQTVENCLWAYTIRGSMCGCMCLLLVELQLKFGNCLLVQQEQEEEKCELRPVI